MANAAASWETMPDTDMAVTDYNITVTDGTTPTTFTFRVRRQPLSTRNIATLATTYERYVLTFVVTDVTDHTATTSPMAVYGVGFTNMLIRALRSLISGGASMIPKPGTQISFGSSTYMIVETTEFAQLSENTADVFLVTCNVKEPSSGSAYLASQTSPRLARSDDVPPWQMPADVVFDAQSSEGMTLGFAYPVGDVDGKVDQDVTSLRTLGLNWDGKMVAIENYANDPFSSPPSFLKTTGTLKVTKAFLRPDMDVSGSDFSLNAGKVNSEDISLDLAGAKFFFPVGTLTVSGIGAVPKVYKKQLPWFNKTKHPLDKTYGELFYGYSGKTANSVAVNKTGETILVACPMRYVEISATFLFRPEGFAVWLANRGYTELDSNTDGGRKDITVNGKTKECWLSKAGTRSDDERIWRGFTMVVQSPAIKNLLSKLLKTGNDFDWATAQDGFGSVV